MISPMASRRWSALILHLRARLFSTTVLEPKIQVIKLTLATFLLVQRILRRRGQRTTKTKKRRQEINWLRKWSIGAENRRKRRWPRRMKLDIRLVPISSKSAMEIPFSLKHSNTARLTMRWDSGADA